MTLGEHRTNLYLDQRYSMKFEQVYIQFSATKTVVFILDEH